MDIKTGNAVRKLLREHKPIGQEGVPTIVDNDGRSAPILCKCGEGGQSWWGYGMPYSVWLDHFETMLLDEML